MDSSLDRTLYGITTTVLVLEKGEEKALSIPVDFPYPCKPHSGMLPKVSQLAVYTSHTSCYERGGKKEKEQMGRSLFYYETISMS
jgi:hypothetical protein